MKDQENKLKTPARKVKRRFRLSKISILHYIRLGYRSVLFILALLWYIIARVKGAPIDIAFIDSTPIFYVIWAVFMIEMLFRFFPSDYESPGCQKQFKRNYIPTGETTVKIHDNNAAIIVILVWIVPNAIFAALNMVNIFDDAVMILISLAYSLCDVICILFYCPFQSIFLKNRCCSSCRIYNWDYIMMFTPLFFVPFFLTWTLLAMALALLVRWEITIWRYPERFSENTNKYLSCANCTEKLCHHKRQLHGFRKHLIQFAEKQKERILAVEKTVEKKFKE